MNIQWVRQEDRYGCSIAVLAMITGLPYQQVRAAVGFDGTLGSSCEARQWAWLKEQGYETTSCFFRTAPVRVNFDRREELIPSDRPYLLWLSVGDGKWMHSVLQLPDGTIWDPEHSEPRQLSDYPDLWQVKLVTRL